MKILVISDSHTKEKNIRNVVKNEKPDKVFHLGDSQLSMIRLKECIGLPSNCVRGNCDMDTSYPLDIIVPLYNHNILLTHGHKYGVKYDIEILKEVSINKGCDIALYGHTHIPFYSDDDIIIANPGSITLPRQIGYDKTYMIMEAYPSGEIRFDLKKYKGEM